LIAKYTPWVVYNIFSRSEGFRGMKIIKIAQQIMFMESLSLFKKKKKEKKGFGTILKLGIEKRIKLIFFIITYWHACVGYPLSLPS